MGRAQVHQVQEERKAGGRAASQGNVKPSDWDTVPWQPCLMPTFTSKQADEAKRPQHAWSEDRQFSLYAISPFIQLDP